MDKKPIREIVKNQEWQRVRISLVGQWKKRPDWCCQQLQHFLGSASSANDDKLRILKNYLYSSGFRIGIIKHPCIDHLRSIVLSEMKKRKFMK
jgi:hypothetical protein